MGTSDMSPVRIALVLSCLAVPAAIADEHEAPGQLSAIDFNFVGQANLGAPFQINSGRIAEVNGSQPAIREYAHLMVTSHIPVVEALNGILQRKNVTPSNALLQGAYNAMLSTLNAETGGALDRDYVNGQVELSKGKCRAFPAGDTAWK